MRERLYKVTLVRPELVIGNLVPYKLNIVSRPTSVENKGGPAGMTVLRLIPPHKLQPAPFKMVKDVSGNQISARKQLEAVVECIVDKHPTGRVRREWEEFLAGFPAGTALEYVTHQLATDPKLQGKQYHETVPFPSLFRPEQGQYLEHLDRREGRGRARGGVADLFGEQMLYAETTASVIWGGDTRATGSFHFISFL
jgi:hypothetical protein